MPHKHKAKGDDPTQYNLPPTSVARSLPVGKHGQSVFTDDKARKGVASERKARAYKADDTPKAFARLMQRQGGVGKKPANGLDNGEARSSKKRKRGDQDKPPSAVEKAKAAAAKQAAAANAAQPALPKIQPGERLADFAARVDQMLPVSGLTRKGKSAAGGPQERQTKTEKRLQKMYAEWREEEARRKEKLEEAQELAEEDEDEEDAMFEDKTAALPATGKGKKRKRMIGEQKDKDDDPWAELKLKRDMPKGLHDVAQAPPEFKTIPREKFKVRNGAIAQVADVPNSAGSLKRREELGEARKSIIEQYRAIMSRGQTA